MFTHIELHRLIHSLTEKEHTQFRTFLRANPSDKTLFDLYRKLRHIPDPADPSIQDVMSGPERQHIKALREKIYVFFLGQEHKSLAHTLLIIRLLIERGLFTHAYDMVMELIENPQYPIPPDLFLILIRYQLFLSRIEGISRIQPGSCANIETLIKEKTATLRHRLFLELDQAELMYALHHPSAPLSPKRLRQLDERLHKEITAYHQSSTHRKGKWEVRFLRDSMRFVLAVLHDRRRLAYPHSPVETAERLIDDLTHLVQHPSAEQGIHQVRRLHIVSEALRILAEQGHLSSARKGLKALHQYVTQTAPGLSASARIWFLTEHLATESLVRSYLLDYDPSVLAIHPLIEPLIQKKTFGRLYPYHDRLIAAYQMACRFNAQEYRPLKRTARLFIQHHHDQLSSRPIPQAGAALYLAALFEEGQARELQRVIESLPPISRPRHAPLHALIQFIRANHFRLPTRTPLRGAETFRRQVKRIIQKMPHTQHSNVRYYPFFDYLAWIEAIQSNRPYRVLIQEKQKALLQ